MIANLETWKTVDKDKRNEFDNSLILGITFFPILRNTFFYFINFRKLSSTLAYDPRQIFYNI